MGADEGALSWSRRAPPRGRRGRPRPSGGRERVPVKFQEVVRGGDRAPFRSDGGAASSVEAIDPAVVLGLAEHGLDHRLALAVVPLHPGFVLTASD